MKNRALVYVFVAVFTGVFLAAVFLLIINMVSVQKYSFTKEEVDSSKQEVTDNYYAEKRDGAIFFQITQTKPSSCHIINFHKKEFGKNIVLDLEITRYADRCSSDNLVDTISGEIEIENPESFEIRVNGKRVYFMRFFNHEDSLPNGYTLDSYTVEETTEISCNSDSDCQTPIDYLVQSRCPFTSLCLEQKCTIVCPEYQNK